MEQINPFALQGIHLNESDISENVSLKQYEKLIVITSDVAEIWVSELYMR